MLNIPTPSEMNAAAQAAANKSAEVAAQAQPAPAAASDSSFAGSLVDGLLTVGEVIIEMIASVG